MEPDPTEPATTTARDPSVPTGHGISAAQLAPELLMKIASYLATSDILHLALACRGFVVCLQTHLLMQDIRSGQLQALTWALEHRDMAMLRRLQQYGIDLDDAAPGGSPLPDSRLMVALLQGDWQLAEILLQLGVDPNRKSRLWKTRPLISILCHAERAKRSFCALSAVRVLLAAGAEVNPEEPRDLAGYRNPLKVAIGAGQHCDDSDGAHSPNKSCVLRLVRALTNAGAEQNLPTNNHAVTPLAEAVTELFPQEAVPVVKVLLGAGADPNQLSTRPMGLSSGRGHLNTCVPADDTSPLVCAIEAARVRWGGAWRRRPLLECLLSNGADPNLVSGPRPVRTPLEHIIQLGFDLPAKALLCGILIKYGADIRLLPPARRALVPPGCREMLNVPPPRSVSSRYGS